jgi:uncharacterized protein YndB with AHSA1/START domain
LITCGRRAEFRPGAIDGTPPLEVATWAEQYRPIWEGRFDRMAEHREVLPVAEMDVWFVGEYVEIVDGERLVYTESMSDADGNIVELSDLDDKLEARVTELAS